MYIKIRCKHIGTSILGHRMRSWACEALTHHSNRCEIQQIQSLLKGFIRSASSGRKREREMMYDTNKALNVDVKKIKHQIVFYNVGLN